MISSQISKKLQQGLSKLRAITEPTDSTNNVTYNTEYTSDEMVTNDHPDQMTFKDLPGYSPFSCDMFDPDDFCYASLNMNPSDPSLPYTVSDSLSAENTIHPDEYKKFYQDIAQAAKEWTDKPSDKKKIVQSLEYVLELAKTAPRDDNRLSERLKRDEMLRIVTRLIGHAK